MSRRLPFPPGALGALRFRLAAAADLLASWALARRAPAPSPSPSLLSLLLLLLSVPALLRRRCGTSAARPALPVPL